MPIMQFLSLSNDMNWNIYCLSIIHIQNNQKHFRIWMWIDKTSSNSSLILNTYHFGTCVNNNRTEPDLLDIIQLSSNPVLNVAPTKTFQKIETANASFLGIKLFFFQDRKLKLSGSVSKLKFMKPRKISTHLAYSDKCYFHLFYQLSDWVEILWGFAKAISQRC